MIYRINSPITVVLPRKTKKDKVIPLNLNWYRNCHFQISNQVKILYCELMRFQIEKLPVFEKINSISYLWFPATNRSSDTANVCCIVDKFFCDALVNLGRITDDNHNLIPTLHYSFGAVSKQNPRVEIYINGEPKLNENSNQSAGN